MTKFELVDRLYAVREAMEAPSSGIAEGQLDHLIREIEEQLIREMEKEVEEAH